MLKTLLMTALLFIPAVTHAEDIYFQWDHDGGVSGYRLYQYSDNEEPHAVGEFQSLTGETTITKSGHYSWYVTAFIDNNGEETESEPSNIVEKTVVSAPTQFKFRVVVEGTVTVE